MAVAVAVGNTPSSPASQLTRGQLGQQGEQEACRFLKRQGLRLLQRNYRCRQGEIDLVMQDRDTLVFIEVRCRSSRNFCLAEASVDARKRRRLLHTAHHYLAQQKHHPQTPCRFDVIGVYPNPPKPSHLEWIRDAFGL